MKDTLLEKIGFFIIITGMNIVSLFYILEIVLILTNKYQYCDIISTWIISIFIAVTIIMIPVFIIMIISGMKRNVNKV